MKGQQDMHRQATEVQENPLPKNPGTPGSPGLSIVFLVCMAVSLVHGISEGHTFLQSTLLLGILIFWGGVTALLCKPTAAQQQEHADRLTKALAKPGDTGLTQEWYSEASKSIQKAGVALTAVMAVVALITMAGYPGRVTSELWHLLKAYVPDHQIFIWGTFLSHCLPFVSLLLIFTPFDLKRPASLMPFKVQEDFVLTRAQLKSALSLTAVNECLSLCYMALLWKIYPTCAPEGLGELPSLKVLVVQILACGCISETLFYFIHRKLHTSWWFTHVHHVHHDFHAPFVCMTMYSHWAEHLGANMTALVAGPLLMGVHVTTWMTWSFISTATFTLGHTGFHIPFVPHAPEVHDFHHSQGYENLGTFTGLLDAVFGTDSMFKTAWQSTLAKNYFSPDYPVDKIIARQGQPQQQRWYTKPIQWACKNILESVLQLTSPSPVVEDETPSENLFWSVQVESSSPTSRQVDGAKLQDAAEVLPPAQAAEMGIKWVLSLGTFEITDPVGEIQVALSMQAPAGECSQLSLCYGSGFGSKVVKPKLQDSLVKYQLTFDASSVAKCPGDSYWVLVGTNGSPSNVMVHAAAVAVPANKE